MHIVSKVGICSNLISDNNKSQAEGTAFSFQFLKIFFFPGYTVVTEKQIECYLYLLIPQLFLEPILTNFQVDIVFHKEHCPEITVAWTIRKFKTPGGQRNRISISYNAYLSTRGELNSLVPGCDKWWAEFLVCSE